MWEVLTFDAPPEKKLVCGPGFKPRVVLVLNLVNVGCKADFTGQWTRGRPARTPSHARNSEWEEGSCSQQQVKSRDGSDAQPTREGGAVDRVCGEAEIVYMHEYAQ